MVNSGKQTRRTRDFCRMANSRKQTHRFARAHSGTHFCGSNFFVLSLFFSLKVLSRQFSPRFLRCYSTQWLLIKLGNSHSSTAFIAVCLCVCLSVCLVFLSVRVCGFGTSALSLSRHLNIYVLLDI